ncbi:hypothetical protein SAMN04489761_4268 [Tenacibaculum sp. MAR_2009_124]|uniref:hypothetical protein n=1 Tax=Tenacibaculum sp. MAR_2009_124 TaxID=1250059 RepID=UPI00089888F9|nr:hypothetical protein [Tenacibaculum sp. MAR_2009_124]SED09872.1 hypothetical protein SAMN04489761_4268 [Tenacibaculum sp. MAR_2009_124]
MKKIKNIHVKVSYVVGLGNIEVPENVMEQLEEIYEENKLIQDTPCCLKYGETKDWLDENIKENDAFQWEHEIEILEKE